MTIDNINIKTTYGIDIADNSLAGLLTYPKCKSFTTIDYPDENGLRADLSEPKLDAYNATIVFNIFSGANLAGFITLLTSQVSHTLSVGSMFTTSGYVISYSQPTLIDGRGTISVSFCINGDYFDGFTYNASDIALSKRDVPDYNYKIDNKSFATYGIFPTGTTPCEILQPHDYKIPQIIKSNYISGHTIDTGATLYKKEKTVRLSLVGRFNANNIYAYKAFLYDWMRAGVRTFTAEGKTMSCWYENSSISKVLVMEAQEIVITFTMNITVNTTV